MAELITKIEVQKNNKNRVNVFIDDQYAFSCDAELVYRYRLKPGNSVEIEKLSELIAEDNFVKAKNDALNIIEHNYKTEKEIFDKLSKKGYNNGTIEKVMEFLAGYDFINDRKYAEKFIEEKSNKSGKNKIIYDLMKKGVDKQVITDSIENISSEDQLKTAVELGLKKYRLLSGRDDEPLKTKEKLYRFLSGKGFGWETVSKAVRKIIGEDDYE